MYILQHQPRGPKQWGQQTESCREELRRVASQNKKVERQTHSAQLGDGPEGKQRGRREMAVYTGGGFVHAGKARPPGIGPRKQGATERTLNRE